MKRTQISFVIPARNEKGNVKKLYEEIVSVFKKMENTYEIIFVDDGSNDGTFEELSKIYKKDKRVNVIKMRGWFGKAVALQVGFNHAKGDIVFTMDADLQDNPKEIPKFLGKIQEGFDLVVGWKKIRHDPLQNVIASRILNNFLIPFMTGVKIHDTNCGYKAYRREVLDNLNLYGEQFRYIPIFATKLNYKVTEIIIEHRKRGYGKTKFGVEKNIKGFLDLLTIVFLTGYMPKPGHFFGGWGLLCFFLGFLIGTYITYLRITTGSIQFRHPLLFLGMLLMIIGIQLFSTGLLAELVIHTKSKFDYTSKIEKKLD